MLDEKKKIPLDCGECEFAKDCSYDRDGKCVWIVHGVYSAEDGEG